MTNVYGMILLRVFVYGMRNPDSNDSMIQISDERNESF